MRAGQHSAKPIASVAAVILTFAIFVASAPLATAQGTLTQTSTTTASATVAQSPSYSTTLAVSGSTGAVTYTQVSAPDGLLLTGDVITTTGYLSSASSYTISGTDSDASGDSGTWTFTLTVSAVGLVTTPTTASVSVANSSTFSQALVTTPNTGTVTLAATSTASGLNFAPSTDIVTTTEPLVAGAYTVSGTSSDTYGDSGTWTFTLTVGSAITQTSSTSASTTTTASSTFAPGAIATSGNVGAVTFVTTSPSSALDVSSSGIITTTGTLSPGVYTVSGTDSDASGDSGTWTFTLSVGSAITQTSSTSASTTTTASSTFAPGAIATSGNVGAVTFVTTSPSSALDVSSSGVITTTGTLSPGAYTVSGTDSDASGDSGTWTFTLSVTSTTSPGSPGSPSSPGSPGTQSSGTLTQTSPTAGSIPTSESASYESSNLTVSGGVGTVTFVTTSKATGLVLKGDVIATTGTLAAGVFTISGTDSDAHGDVGKWAFTLTVTPGAITQTSPLSGTTTVAASRTFTPGTITVKHSTGTVSFVTTSPSAALRVSSSGVIATTGTLAVGSYKVSGTDRDADKNTGTWTYTLFVVGTTEQVTFVANGGAGTMTPERSNTPKALTGDRFIRTGYAFSNWSTEASGRGTVYDNGATYSFASSLTLYAQWKKGVSPTRIVFFNPHGGHGAMSARQSNHPATLPLNAFVRPGYTFARWTTNINGTGASYPNGAVYSFAMSITLYAQWNLRRIPSHTVTFGANDGVGFMRPERGTGPKALAPDRFTRHGYRFLYWSTSAHGKGAIYSNGAIYSFTTSATLYAQWKKIVVLPAVDVSATISSFAITSSTLTPSLERQIAAIATMAKTNRDTRIALTGYGDRLSKADELNEVLWNANYALSERRAATAASYLRQRLTALGLRSVVVTSVGSGSPIGSSASAKYGLVVADLT